MTKKSGWSRWHIEAGDGKLAPLGPVPGHKDHSYATHWDQWGAKPPDVWRPACECGWHGEKVAGRRAAASVAHDRHLVAVLASRLAAEAVGSADQKSKS